MITLSDVEKIIKAYLTLRDFLRSQNISILELELLQHERTLEGKVITDTDIKELAQQARDIQVVTE